MRAALLPLLLAVAAASTQTDPPFPTPRLTCYPSFDLQSSPFPSPLTLTYLHGPPDTLLNMLNISVHVESGYELTVSDVRVFVTPASPPTASTQPPPPSTEPQLLLEMKNAMELVPVSRGEWHLMIAEQVFPFFQQAVLVFGSDYFPTTLPHMHAYHIEPWHFSPDGGGTKIVAMPEDRLVQPRSGCVETTLPACEKLQYYSMMIVSDSSDAVIANATTVASGSVLKVRVRLSDDSVAEDSDMVWEVHLSGDMKQTKSLVWDDVEKEYSASFVMLAREDQADSRVTITSVLDLSSRAASMLMDEPTPYEHFAQVFCSNPLSTQEVIVAAGSHAQEEGNAAPGFAAPEIALVELRLGDGDAWIKTNRPRDDARGALVLGGYELVVRERKPMQILTAEAMDAEFGRRGWNELVMLGDSRSREILNELIDRVYQIPVEKIDRGWVDDPFSHSTTPGGVHLCLGHRTLQAELADGVKDKAREMGMDVTEWPSLWERADVIRTEILEKHGFCGSGRRGVVVVAWLAWDPKQIQPDDFAILIRVLRQSCPNHRIIFQLNTAHHHQTILNGNCALHPLGCYMLHRGRFLATQHSGWQEQARQRTIAAAQKYKIPTCDLFRLSRSRRDTSWDGVHYRLEMPLLLQRLWECILELEEETDIPIITPSL